MLARTIIEGICVEAHLTRAFLKALLKMPMDLQDIENSDEALYQFLIWIKNNKVDEDELDMPFTVDIDDMGVHRTVELLPNGENIRVNEENKEEFIRLMIQHRLVTSIKAQTDAFCDGFYSSIPIDDLKMFKPNELDLLICGLPEIDVEDLRKNCKFDRPYRPDHPVIVWLFNVLERCGPEFRAKFLLFLTGSSQIPVGGFKVLADMGREIRIGPGGGHERLPCAHTCSNRLDLPNYGSEKELEEKLMLAIQECNTFGFA